MYMLSDAMVKMNEEISYTCGNLGTEFSSTFPYICHIIVLIIKIAIPILLVIFGMLDLGKAVVASKEDEIKKGQQLFIRRIVSAILVFFVVMIVQIVVKFASSSDVTIVNCMNCFINGTISDKSCREA